MNTARRLVTVMWVAVVIFAAAALPLGTSRAQGGLDDEQIALLDRVYAAREKMLATSTYVEEATGMDMTSILVKQDSDSVLINTTTNWERTTHIWRVDNKLDAVQALIVAEVENSRANEGLPYTLNAEVRLVDDTLYVLAEYLGEDLPADLPEIPTGWVEVADPDQWAGLGELNLDEYLDEDSPFDNMEVVKNAALDVTSEPGTLEDGTPVDVITVTFDIEGMRALYSETAADSPTMGPMLEKLGANSQGIVAFSLDADGTLVYIENGLTFESLDLDAALLMSNPPEGMTVDLTIGMTREQTFSRFGEALEPVTVPEELAP